MQRHKREKLPLISVNILRPGKNFFEVITDKENIQNNYTNTQLL